MTQDSTGSTGTRWRRFLTRAAVPVLCLPLAATGPGATAAAPGSLTTDALVHSGDLVGVRDIVAAGGTRAYFVGATSAQGDELWVSDGTTEGTSLVRDALPGAGSGLPYLTDGRSLVIGGTLYFVAGDGVHGYTLWRSDGTSAGTAMVEDVVPGRSDLVEVESLTRVGSGFRFLVVTGTGLDLWTSDGTPGGTTRIAGTGSCEPAQCDIRAMASLGSRSVFVGGDGALWSSDGTPGGTGAIGPVGARDLTVSAGQVYFTLGHELWRTDGTPGGTGRVPGDTREADFPDYISGLTDVAGELFYMVDYLATGSGQPYELRRVDATSGAGALVRGFGTAEGGDIPTRPGAVATLDGVLYFVPMLSRNFDWFPGRALWRSDGTAAGTYKIEDRAAYRLEVAAGQLLFATPDPSSDSQWWLWRTDGSTGNAVPAAGPFRTPFGMVDFVQPDLADVGGQAWYAARDVSDRLGLRKLGEDLSPPDTRIDDGFAAGEVVTAYAASTRRFTFGVLDDFTPTAGTVFEVQVDGGPWWPYGTTYDFQVREFGTPLDGVHTIAVRAVDAAGRVDPTPASRTFTIDLAPDAPPPPATTGPAPGPETTEVSTSTRLRLEEARIPRTARAVAVVRVRPAGSVPATGTVVIKAGRTAVASARVRSGRATVRLPRLRPGRYRITAWYRGTRVLLPSTSAPRVLVVTR